MQRIAFTMTIRPGTEAEYERRHRQVWAGMLHELRTAGAHTYSIFRQGTLLFAYLEVDDLARYQRYLAGSSIAAKWEAHMSDILIREVDPATDFPPLIPEVFHLDEETSIA
jgi:L-rhamnose mutarotase